MKITSVILLILILLVACENPGRTQGDQQVYQGQTVQTDKAPFLLNTNNLAKVSDGTAIIEESSSDGTVYGLVDESTVYAAEGGEALPKDTWIDNLESDPVEVSLTSGLVITFEQLTTVTIIAAANVIYIDANGVEVIFSGNGVVTTLSISTGVDGAVTLISSAKFGIGGEGGDAG